MIDRQSLFFVHGLLLGFLGLLMVLCAGVGSVAGTQDVSAFLAAGGLTFAFGGLVFAASGGRIGAMNRKTGFALTVSVWVMLSIAAGFPLYFLPAPLTLAPVDSVFEGVSGLTTTGASIFPNLEQLPPGVLLWRGLLNWLGGAGTIAAAFVLMPFLQVGGMQLHRATASAGTPSPLGARRTAIALLAAYGTLTVLCGLLYWFEGMTEIDALVYAMATISTGGAVTHASSLGFFQDPAIQWTAGAFMIAGSLPFFLYVRTGQGEFFAILKDHQVRFFLAVIASAAVAIILVQSLSGVPVEAAVRPAVVTAISFASSTGFTTADLNPGGAIVQSLIFALLVIGGCSGSPAGGMKIMRLQILAQVLFRQLKRLGAPRAVFTLKYESRALSNDIMTSVAAFILLYLSTIFVLGFSLALCGLDVVASLSSAAAALGNVNLDFKYANLPDAAKLILCVGMLLGRLEIFTALVLITPSYWRS